MFRHTAFSLSLTAFLLACDGGSRAVAPEGPSMASASATADASTASGQPASTRLLLYEPEKNGQLRFIGVEYIVLFSDHPATEPPPTLLGQAFEAVPDAGLWGLHIYVGQDNPSGIFATWNPRVNCDNAGTTTSAAGHRYGR